MGSWSFGPFENDGAADLLAAMEDAPGRRVTKALRAVAEAPTGVFLDVDDGSAAWAACEIVALAFGQAGDENVDEHVRKLAGRIRATESQRVLALGALARIRDPALSELAGLWHGAGDGRRLDEALSSLGRRLAPGTRPTRSKAKRAAHVTTTAKRIVLRPGDICQFPTEGDHFGYCQVLNHGDMAFLAYSGPPLSSIDEVVRLPKAFRVVVFQGVARRYGWTKLGSRPIPPELAGEPVFVRHDRFSGEVTRCQGLVETTSTAEECRGLEVSAVWDHPHVVERLLAALAGRPSVWLESMGSTRKG